jgi:integrase
MKGNLRQRTKGRWEITVDIGNDPVSGKRQQHHETVHGNKGKAQTRLSELLTEIARKGYVKTPKDLTVAEYMSSWLKGYVEVNCAPKTIEVYSMIVNKHIIPEIGNVKLIDLEPRHLQTLYSRKKESGLGARSVRYIYSIAHEALGHAVKTEVIYRNVAQATKPPRLEHRTIQTLAPEQISQLLETVQDEQYFTLFYLLLHTGMRRGEALALKWSYVDFGVSALGTPGYISVSESFGKVDGQGVTKETKTAAGKRRIALPPSLVLVLKQHKEAQKAILTSLDGKLVESEYVFCHPDRRQLDPSTVTHTFAKMLKHAGLPPMRLHNLRHSHATLLLSAGVHPKVVQERLGHSSIRTTLDTYSAVVPGLQEAAAQKFDEFLSANAKPEKNVDKMLTETEKAPM